MHHEKDTSPRPAGHHRRDRAPPRGAEHCRPRGYAAGVVLPRGGWRSVWRRWSSGRTATRTRRRRRPRTSLTRSGARSCCASRRSAAACRNFRRVPSRRRCSASGSSSWRRRSKRMARPSPWPAGSVRLPLFAGGHGARRGAERLAGNSGLFLAEVRGDGQALQAVHGAHTRRLPHGREYRHRRQRRGRLRGGQRPLLHVPGRAPPLPALRAEFLRAHLLDDLRGVFAAPCAKICAWARAIR